MQTFTLAVVVVITLLFSPVSFAGETPAAEKTDGSPQTTEAQQPPAGVQNGTASQETGLAPAPQATITDATAGTPPAPQTTDGTTSTQAAGAEPQATPETTTEEKKE